MDRLCRLFGAINATNIFRVFLTINATCLLVVVYLVKAQIVPAIAVDHEFKFAEVIRAGVYLSYILIPLFLTRIALFFARWLGSDNLSAGSVESVEYANNSFLPSYLGYFFVALSIPNFETIFFVYILLSLFTFMSQALYFNPMFLLFGYSFYNVKMKNGLNLFVITKQKFRSVAEIQISGMKRINDYTFLEL